MGVTGHIMHRNVGRFGANHDDGNGRGLWENVGTDPAPSDLPDDDRHQDGCVHTYFSMRENARPKCGANSCAFGLPLSAVADRPAPSPRSGSVQNRATATSLPGASPAPAASGTPTADGNPGPFPMAVRGDFLSAAA